MDRITEIIILPSSWHLAACPEMSFWSLGFTKSRRHYAGKCAQNGTKSLSGREVVRVVRLNTRAQKPQCCFFSRSHLPTPLHCKNGAAFFPDGPTRGSEARSHTTQQTVNGQHFAPSREKIRLSTNTRIMQPPSPCRGKASLNCLLFQPQSPHSLLAHTFWPLLNPRL